MTKTNKETYEDAHCRIHKEEWCCHSPFRKDREGVRKWAFSDELCGCECHTGDFAEDAENMKENGSDSFDKEATNKVK